MNDIMAKLQNLMSPDGALVHALIGLAILIVGLFIVKIIAGIISRLLGRISFMKLKGSDGSVTDLTKPIGSIIKAVLTIFVLIAVLQHFGLTNVLAPLQDMANDFLAAIPKVIGAGIIAYVGWILAKIVSDLVGMALGKVDNQLAERTGNSELQIAPFGSAFIFGGILLPIIVAALGVLDIPAISEPASEMLQKLMAAVPNIIGAAIILLVSYYVLKFVVFMLSGLLNGMNIDAMPKKFGMKLFSGDFTLTKFIGSAIMFFGMLAAAAAAVEVLNIPVITAVFAEIMRFGGGIFVGGLILVIGNILSGIAYDNLKKQNGTLANIARFAILGLVLAMGLRSMGLADNIVNMAFGFTIGAVAIAFALAFGFGGRDAAKAVSDNWVKKIK